MYSTCCLYFVLLPCWKKEEDFLFIFAFFFGVESPRPSTNDYDDPDYDDDADYDDG